MPSNGRPGPASAATLPSIGARRSASVAAPSSRPPPGRARAAPPRPARSPAGEAAHLLGHGRRPLAEPRSVQAVCRPAPGGGPGRGGGQAVAVATEELAACAAQRGCATGLLPRCACRLSPTSLSVLSSPACEQHESSGFDQVRR